MTAQRRHIARFEHSVRADLVARRWLRWHSFLLASVCFGVLWVASASLLRAGLQTLALRWPLALAVTYVAFIALLWLWCRWLLSREEANLDGPDVPANSIDITDSPGSVAELPWRSGEGGDFGGGGASGSFDPGSAVEGASKAAGKVLEVAGDAEEGIVVVVPVAVVVGVAVLLAGTIGIAVLGLFGIEVLLGVAVEIAIASAGGALAYRARREGWLAHAVSRTIRPVAVILLFVVALGAAIDHWLPQADSLPQALRLLKP